LRNIAPFGPVRVGGNRVLQGLAVIFLARLERPFKTVQIETNRWDFCRIFQPKQSDHVVFRAPSKKIGAPNFDTWKQGVELAMAHYSACGIFAHKLNDKY
jgi:hypothetical protein